MFAVQIVFCQRSCSPDCLEHRRYRLVERPEYLFLLRIQTAKGKRHIHTTTQTIQISATEIT